MSYYLISQGHKSNVIGRAATMQEAKRLILNHMGRRWKTDGHRMVTTDREVIVTTGNIAVRYELSRRQS